MCLYYSINDNNLKENISDNVHSVRDRIKNNCLIKFMMYIIRWEMLKECMQRVLQLGGFSNHGLIRSDCKAARLVQIWKSSQNGSAALS